MLARERDKAPPPVGLDVVVLLAAGRARVALARVREDVVLVEEEGALEAAGGGVAGPVVRVPRVVAHVAALGCAHGEGVEAAAFPVDRHRTGVAVALASGQGRRGRVAGGSVAVVAVVDVVAAGGVSPGGADGDLDAASRATRVAAAALLRHHRGRRNRGDALLLRGGEGRETGNGKRGGERAKMAVTLLTGVLFFRPGQRTGAIRSESAKK